MISFGSVVSVRRRYGWLVFLVLWTGNVDAKTCGDVSAEWETRFQAKHELTINHSESTPTNSKNIASDAARRKIYLRCSASVSIDFSGPPASSAPSSDSSIFKLRVGKAYRENPNDYLKLRMAIYLRYLAKRHSIFDTDASWQWDLKTAHDWCEAGGRKLDSTPIPNSLPSLQMGLEVLDPLAIQLAWTLVESWPVRDLFNGCDTSARELASLSN